MKPLQILDFEWVTQVGMIYRQDEAESIEQKEFTSLLLQKIPHENDETE